MRDGVKVKFSNLSGFIHRNHIPDSGKHEEGSNSTLEHGAVVFGRVLYVVPVLKHVYFSGLSNVCNICEEIPKPSVAETNFQVGDIVHNAKVTCSQNYSNLMFSIEISFCWIQCFHWI